MIWAIVFINYRLVGNDVEFTNIIAFQVKSSSNYVNILSRITDILRYWLITLIILKRVDQ